MQELSVQVTNLLKIDCLRGIVYSRQSGKEIGSMGSGGYIYVAVKDLKTGKYQNLKRSRLVFFSKHGFWPEQVDHINRDRTDDRIENLREVNAREQALNRSTNVRELPRGVQISGNNYSSSIYYADRAHHLGTFSTIEEASDAYEIAKQRIDQGKNPITAKQRKEKELLTSCTPDAEVLSRIRNTFSMYPIISPSMLQISLNLPVKIWRPVLEWMVDQGEIDRSTQISITPTGRHQSYTVLRCVGESE